MALTLDDIRPGCVAYLDTSVLLRDSRLQRTGDGLFRSGPFLCLSLRPGQTVWYQITTKPGSCGKRFLLQPNWVTGGSARWRSDTQYVKDLREPFIARDVVFLEAGAHEAPYVLFDRPHVSQAGIEAIVAEMRARNCLTV